MTVYPRPFRIIAREDVEDFYGGHVPENAVVMPRDPDDPTDEGPA